jgi:lipoyl(octanoyl) transferase
MKEVRRYTHSSSRQDLRIYILGQRDYVDIWQKMKSYTVDRDSDSYDQIWIVEHDPVYTLGQASEARHLLAPGDIPVVQTDRGGQVTYHGPGQLVMYPLVNIKRIGMNVREFVTAIETSIIDVLFESYNIEAYAKKTAPGVYVQTGGSEAKIASLGLRVKRGSTYHGLSVNTNMSLEPFCRINPCGYANMPITQLCDVDEHSQAIYDINNLGIQIATVLLKKMGYSVGE